MPSQYLYDYMVACATCLHVHGGLAAHACNISLPLAALKLNSSSPCASHAFLPATDTAQYPTQVARYLQDAATEAQIVSIICLWIGADREKKHLTRNVVALTGASDALQRSVFSSCTGEALTCLPKDLVAIALTARVEFSGQPPWRTLTLPYKP
jgi:hypothetical protein